MRSRPSQVPRTSCFRAVLSCHGERELEREPASAILTNVKALSAHVRNGQIVLDVAVELPEGAAVEVLLPDSDDLTTAERSELDAALDESAAQFARGEFEDAHEFARRLVAKP